MGSFEKLGILVIVVIIVMILAVAIAQWGRVEPLDAEGAGDRSGPSPLVIDVEDLTRAEQGSDVVHEASGALQGPDEARRGVPREYEIRPNDVIWKLVVNTWRLRDSYVREIERANPRIDMRRLQPGTKIRLPDPTGFFRDRRGGAEASATKRTRIYRIQEGDKLESIARTHLGDPLRWREILSLNAGLDPRRLAPGQEIRIPAR